MRALALLLLLSFAAAAAAQLRTIPADTKVGVIRHVQEMQVEIDGTPQRLSPGAQIRDTDNRLVLPISLTEKQLMRYLVDAQGLVHRVWILSAQERAQAEKELPKPKPKPKPPAEKKDAAEKK
jgi:hypothetical protein